MMASPETFRALLVANAALPQHLDAQHRTKNLCGNFNEFLYKMAHEPSLAGHRVQEHVYKTVPILTREQAAVSNVTSRLKGVLFDLDYTTAFLDKLDESIQNSSETRESISELASRMSAANSRASGPGISR